MIKMKLRVDTPVLLNAANDLVFQAIDWQGGDEPETLKPGDVWPVDWKKKKEEMEEDLDPEMEPNDEDDERREELHRQMGQRIHMIRIFGITAEGHSVCIHIRDYHPFVYVKPPRGMVWGDRETKNFADWLDKSLRNWVDSFSGKTKDKHGDLLQIELEHRKDFIGFREEKPEPFLKLTFKNSATCKAVARFLDEKAPRLRNGDIPFEVFEANIEPMIRLIHQQDLAPVGWIRIPAGKFKILQRSQKWSICQIEVETTNVELYPVDSSSIGPMLIASFDLECTSGDGSFPKPERLSDAIIQIGTTVFKYAERTPSAQYIFTLGECAPIDNVVVVSCRTERDLLKEWAKFMRKLDADVVTGYNIWGFDWVYYKKRCEVLKITEECFQLGRLIGRPSIWTEKTLSSSALGDNFLKFFDLTGRIQIDMLKVVQNGMEKLDMYKLDFVANHYLKMNKVDLSPKELFQRYRSGTPDDIKEIAVYCVQDCALVNQLINKLEIITNNAGMGNVCYVPLSWLFLRGQGVKIFSLVSRQCRKEGFCMPWIRRGVYWRRRDYPQVSEESSYEGAIVLVATPGIYLDPIFVMDYNSLYPSSMIAENISHDSVVWFRIIDLEGNMVYQWGDESYDNLPNYNYWNIEFDNFVGEGDKKQKSGKTIVRYAENKNGVKNVVPRILQGLLKARKDTRKQMEIQVIKTNEKTLEGWYVENGDNVEITGVDGSKTKLLKTEIIEKKDKYNSFQQKVLDGLQLAYKVTANSLYGQVGAATSPICMKELAASTTATGRQQLKIARNFVEREYPGAVAVYGDSVTGDTPLILRHPDGKIMIRTIETLSNEWDSYENFKPWDTDRKEKQQAKVDLEIWTNGKWAKIHRVIRHKTCKKMYRVWTDKGVVDVTEDHSLLDENMNQLKPGETKLNETNLLHSFPEHLDQLIQFDKKGTKTWAQIEYFNKKQQGIQNIQIVEHHGYYTVEESTFMNTDKVRKVIELPVIDDSIFVYDIETSEGIFQGGIGEIVLKNTDSVFINAVPHLNKIHNREIRGQEALELSIELGQKVAKRISAECLKKPQNLAYEKTLYPFIQLAKKRYVGNLYEEDPHKFKLKYMGIVLKRRDNANIVKKIYGGMISSLLNDQDLDKAIAFFQDQVENLLNGNVDLKELVITKTLKGSYKNRDQIAHAVLADRMGLRDPGNKPAANDRIPYIYIETQSTNNKILQGDKIEHPDYIKARLDEIRPDYRYYYEHQVKVPCIQLLALALEKLPGYQDGWWERWVEWMDEQKLEGKRREHKTSELRERETERLLCSIFIRDDDAKRKMRNDEKQLKEGVSRTVGQLSMARFVSQTPINTQNAEKKLEILKKRVEQEQEEQNRKSQSKLKIAGKTIDEFWKKR